MTDLTEIYEEGSGAPRYVVRLSRTSTGTRTYTVGMSLNGADIDGLTVRRLFDLERAVIREIDGSRRAPVASLERMLRRSVAQKEAVK